MRQNKKKRISRAESLREGQVLARAGPDHATVVLQEHLRGGADLWIAPDRLRRASPHTSSHKQSGGTRRASHSFRHRVCRDKRMDAFSTCGYIGLYVVITNILSITICSCMCILTPFFHIRCTFVCTYLMYADACLLFCFIRKSSGVSQPMS